MDELIRQLNLLSNTTQKLEKYIHKLTSEKVKLQKQVDDLKELQERKDEEIKELHEKYEATKLVKGLVEHADQEEIKEKIDTYLKEIDICLKIFGDQNLVGNTVN